MKFSAITTDEGIRTVDIREKGTIIGHLSYDAEAGSTWVLMYNGNAHDTLAKTVKEAKEWAKGFIVSLQAAEQDAELPEGTVIKEDGEVVLPEGALEEAIAEDNEDEDEDDGDSPAPHSVVKVHYQRLYKETSTSGRSCGDWLAENLDGLFITGGPKKKDMFFDYDGFESFLLMNDVKLGHWATVRHTGNRGWQGRYRMNGRLALEQILAERGTVCWVPGTDEEVDADWRDTMLTKYPKIARRLAENAEEAEATT